MNVGELKQLIRKVYNENIQSEENDWEGYEYIGIRFEDKEREIGEVCEYSRNNVNREDERDFPEYGTDEYWEMEELDGTSAWGLEFDQDILFKSYGWEDDSKDAESVTAAKHCYIIASNRLGHTSNTVIDYNEIVIKDAVVIAKIF